MLTSGLVSTRAWALSSSSLGFRRLRGAWLIAALGVAAVLPWNPSQANAEVIAFSSTTVSAGQAGYLDIYFGEASGEHALAGYQIELNLSGPDAGVWFTGFAEPANAIFPGQVALQTAGRPTLPGQVAAANDFLDSGEAPITDGAGLLRILFATAPGSLGTYQVTVDTNIIRTNFSDGSGTLIPITSFGTAAIIVVPEPSSLLMLLGIGAFGTMAHARRRAGRVAKTAQECDCLRHNRESRKPSG